jgi:hypothetical protein
MLNVPKAKRRRTPLGYRLIPYVAMPRAVECGALIMATVLANCREFKANVARDDGSLKLTNSQLAELIATRCGETPNTSFTGSVIRVLQYLFAKLGYHTRRIHRALLIYPPTQVPTSDGG